MLKSHKVSFVSLGCPKATVDSEHIITALQDSGFDVVPEDDHDASVVVINTCGFIDAAKQESIDTISRAYGDNRKVIVTGCMGKDPTALQAEFSQLEAISGPAEVVPVVQAVQTYLPEVAAPVLDSLGVDALSADALSVDAATRTRLTPAHYAYLKISEGCNHKCAFCIIPQMRGKLRSRQAADVLAEAQQLVEDGVQELLLVAQDLSAYGLDLRYASSQFNGADVTARLYNLCEQLGPMAPWVRLHYVYPYPHVDDIIPLMADGRILPYLDMPLQHASQKVLTAMRRPAARAKTLDRIARWRELCPELVIRSTFIVGFPGETEADVGELLDFLQEAQLDRVGCFSYSAVDGARANSLPDHVDQSAMLDRQEMVYETQATISAHKLQQRVGSKMRILIDDVLPGGDGTGRSYADAPEIDGTVHISGDGSSNMAPGEFVWVEIESADDHDLYGRVAGSPVTLI